MIKFVIFDIEGVIKDIKNTSVLKLLPLGLRRKYKSAYKNMGLKDYFVKYLQRGRVQSYEKGLINAERFLISVAEDTGEPLEVLKILNEKINSKKQIVLFKPTLKFMEKLKAEKFSVLIFANTNADFMEVFGKMLNKKYYHDMVLSYRIKEVKPDEEAYKAALRRWKARPEECLLVDDREKNLIPFTRMGGHSIFFDVNNVLGSIDSVYDYLTKFNIANPEEKK